MKLAMVRFGLFIVFAMIIGSYNGMYAQDISGQWCTKDNPADCIVIEISPKNPEIVSARLVVDGKLYADATGYFRDGKLALAFRRTNDRDIGFMTFILKDAKSADARTFNPDGSQRWKGVYLR